MAAVYSNEDPKASLDVKKKFKKILNYKLVSLGRRSKLYTETEINESETNRKHLIKILVVGPGNSGKSTILKQMRIIHGENYSVNDRKKFKLVVIQNLLESICCLVRGMREFFDLQFENESNNQAIERLMGAKMILEENSNDLSDWYVNAKTYANLLTNICNDSAIKLTFEQKNKFFLSKSSEYWFANVDRICSSNYIPSVDDILRARQPTSSIKENIFNINGTIFNFFDVGGQRSERRKWINCFENVTSMLFVTSMVDFDQMINPNELKASGKSALAHVNKMKEGLSLFETLINWKMIDLNQKKNIFEKISVILFLNKADLFEKQYEIQNSAIKKCFDDYDEHASLDESKEFIARKFVECKKSRSEIYYHFTCALDTHHLKTIISGVKDVIFQGLVSDLILY